MSQMLEQLRQQLEQIVLDAEAQAQERERQLVEREQKQDEREQAVAAALELLSIDPAVARAYDQGQADAKRRVQRLIELQLEHLPRTSSARTVLHTLSRMVEDRE